MRGTKRKNVSQQLDSELDKLSISQWERQSISQFARTLQPESLQQALLSERLLSVAESSLLWSAICGRPISLEALCANALKYMLQSLFERGLEHLVSDPNCCFGRNALARAVDAFRPSNGLLHELLNLYQENPALNALSPNSRNIFREPLISEAIKSSISLSVFVHLLRLSSNVSLNSQSRHHRTPLIDLIMLLVQNDNDEYFERICALLDETITRSDGTGVQILENKEMIGCVHLSKNLSTDPVIGKAPGMHRLHFLPFNPQTDCSQVTTVTPLQFLRICKNLSATKEKQLEQIERLLLDAETRIKTYRKHFVPSLDNALSAFLPVTVLRHVLIRNYILSG